MKFSFVFLLFIQSFFLYQCSSGDENLQFKECVEECVEYFSDSITPSIHNFFPLHPITSKLFFWSFDAECKYQCMHIYSLRGMSKNPQKYYGKWPFIRIFGMQEFFSVIFSLATLVIHDMGYANFVKHVPTNSSKKPDLYLYRSFYYLGIAAWLASAVFHARDTVYTQFFDYSLALANVMYMTYIAIVRTFLSENMKMQAFLAKGLSLYWIGHYYYMQAYSFDYGWNMKVNILFSIVHGIAWGVWLWRNHPLNKRISNLVWFFFWALLSFAMASLDFSPFYGLVDSHALWHMFLICAVYHYWSFLTIEWIEGSKKQPIKRKKSRKGLEVYTLWHGRRRKMIFSFCLY